MLPHESIINDAEIRKRASVQLDCTKFHRSDALTVWKNRLIVGLGVATILVGLAWWVSGWWSGGNSPVFAPGEVASVHAAWETQCTACHDPHSSVGNGWGAQTFGVSHTPDPKCQVCHAGPKHHKNEDPASTPTCAACHLEHRGREAILTRNDDRYCTTCHSKLEGSAKVASWATHPEFRTVAARHPDHQQKLEFNHELHLRKGLGRIAGSTLRRWGDLDQIDPGFRKRIGADGADAAEPVQLDCAACHQSDDSRGLNRPTLPGRSPGSIMQPISYDVHCKVCHPLTVPLPGDPREVFAVPHGQPLDKIGPMIEGLIASRAMHAKPADASSKAWGLPGKDQREKMIRDSFETWLNAVQGEIGSKKLCRECHSLASVSGQKGFASQRIVLTRVPDIWYEQSRFNHASHRMLNCVECHAGVATSTKAMDVLIPSLENCKQCHGPAQTASDGPRGGVRASCVTCHYYHNGDHPRQGKGAAMRATTTTRTLKDFLKPE